MGLLVCLIVTVRLVRQVGGSIVLTVSIEVSYLHTLRDGTKEGFSHQSMHLLRVTTTTKHELVVTSRAR